MREVMECLWCGHKELDLFAHRKDGVGIVECKNCRLVMTKQVPKNPRDLYEEEYFTVPESNIHTGIETGYAGSHVLISPAFLFWQNALIEELNEKYSPKNFLEIGSATGNLLQILKENQPNLVLNGIDISNYAVQVASEKGFKVQRAVIEEYTAKPKMDIIFSSETMEHLIDLKSFLKGVNENLSENGVFVFYVPSISIEDARKQKGDYMRFTMNMEHLLHFTPGFFSKELPKLLNKNVIIKEFKTTFGPSIIGAVSKDSSQQANLNKLFEILETEQLPAKTSKTMLKNVMIFAVKFVQFDFADKILRTIQKQNKLAPKDINLLRALYHYHKGELEKANGYFEAYLQLSPASSVALMLLAANERELHRIHAESYVSQLDNVKNRLDTAEAKLNKINKSKIISSGLKLRAGIKKSLKNTRGRK